MAMARSQNERKMAPVFRELRLLKALGARLCAPIDVPNWRHDRRGPLTQTREY